MAFPANGCSWVDFILYICCCPTDLSSYVKGVIAETVETVGSGISKRSPSLTPIFDPDLEVTFIAHRTVLSAHGKKPST